MSEADLTQLGIELSLQHMQQQHQQLLHYQQEQFHNNDLFQSFASSTGNAQAQGNSSISPMPSTVTRTSVPLANTKTPEHKPKTHNALVDFMYEDEFGGGVNDDAVAALDAFDNPEHFAQPTMQRVSKRLFDKETKTPEIAERIVNLYKSLEENHNKSQKKG